MEEPLSLASFQRRIEEIYYAKDSARGLDETFMWFVEEVGELSRALRRGTAVERADEFSDVLAWLCTLASLAEVDLAAASAKYLPGCPKCAQAPCTCPEPRSTDF
jgi:NTP pyrophosphatase (non-canonical NTP hydrolase)